MNEDFAVKFLSQPWRAGGAGGGFLLYAALGMQVPPGTPGRVERAASVQAFAALVYVALVDLTPSGAHKGYDMGRMGNWWLQA